MLLIKGIVISRILKRSGNDVVKDLRLLNEFLWVCDMGIGNWGDIGEVRAWLKSVKMSIIILDMIINVPVVR
jgi:hypothetical protein